MKDSQNHKILVSLTEVHGVGKAPQHGASHVANDHWVAFGMVGRTLDRLFDLLQELVAEPAPAVFVPSDRLFKLVPRGTSEDDAQAHPPSRARTDAFTSLHGVTSPG